MKKLIVGIFTSWFSIAASACDICGCGVGNYYIGLLPQISKSFLGIRYQFSSFHSSIKDNPADYNKDLFHTVEVRGGLNIGK